MEKGLAICRSTKGRYGRERLFSALPERINFKGLLFMGSLAEVITQLMIQGCPRRSTLSQGCDADHRLNTGKK